MAYDEANKFASFSNWDYAPNANAEYEVVAPVLAYTAHFLMDVMHHGMVHLWQRLWYQRRQPYLEAH